MQTTHKIALDTGGSRGLGRNSAVALSDWAIAEFGLTLLRRVRLLRISLKVS